VGCCTPPRSIFYNMAGGVAGRLGVAYRRHADVRRSANDWSIATRRFSARKLLAPFPLPRPFLALARAQFTRTVCVSRARVSVCRSSPNNPTGSAVSSPWRKPFSQPIALRLRLRGSSRVDLFTSASADVSKKWRISSRAGNPPHE